MKKISSLLVILLLVSCASTKDKDQDPSPALQEIINKRSFSIHSKEAEPQMTTSMMRLSNMGFMQANNVGGIIDIRGNHNFFTFKNDSIIASLPYYGERQLSQGYNNIDKGITLKGIPDDLEITQDGSTYNMRFTMNDANAIGEHYEVMVRLSSKLSSFIDIRSSHRLQIRYRGRVISEAQLQKMYAGAK